ncbi:hypothetical protein BK011_06905 [Tenericutes bacterium MZ-XQ]|nr:hypothetical protein BK011_06905 [Tenericutes bacterium MZ-XQ]
MQQKLKKGPLLNQQGELIEAGYHTSLIKTYDKKLVRNSRMRLKEWDYYYVGNDDYGIALTVADNGYMWLLSATLFDFNLRKEISKSKMGWIPFKRFNMPETSEKDNVMVHKGQWKINYKIEKDKRHIEAEIPNFNKGEALIVDLYLDAMIDDSMVIATPFANRKRFYYNQKINLLKSSGRVILGDEIFDFNGAYGVLDWGRGAWTYHNIWYWSSLSGEQNGHKIGFNLGYGFGDTSKASENMLFYDDQTYKLDDVEFIIPKDGIHYDYLSTWMFKSKDGKIDLTFEPIIDRNSSTNIIILKSVQHQVFGRFSGTFKVENKEIIIKDMLGFAERVENKW